MRFTPSKLNAFLFFKLPSAYISGVRVKSITESECIAVVTHRWINQNPFKSIYFAVQAMAAELTTGVLVMYHIRKSGCKISMLVLSNKSHFTKKAIGKISFICNDGYKIEEVIKKAIETKQGQTCLMKSVGINQEGEQVSEFYFEWTVKVK
ncbi:MAG: DUF4442 domain-containing protein [Flavobacteriaceae bacterium]